MSEIETYPLTWPAGWKRTPAHLRKRARFTKSQTHMPNPITGHAARTLHELTVSDGARRVVEQLGMMGIRDYETIVSTNVRPRLDGLPRSGERAPEDPGAAVYWRAYSPTGPKGPQRVMAIDLYDRVADNLAAIAATLEAMRAIERHGGAQILERAFTGFDALPAPKEWWEILELETPNVSRETINARFRELAGKHHPDRAGGSHDRMAEITRARDDGLKATP